MITDIEDYFTKGCGRCARFDTADCSIHRWLGGLNELRKICLAVGLSETVKWGHPCYMHAGRNIAIFGAFRDNFRLTFINAALLKDGDGVLAKQGPNTSQADMIRFTNSAQVAVMREIIHSYLREAMGYAQVGIKPVKQVGELELPDELVDALEGDTELADAFRALTPGRQKSYVINLMGTKVSATRVARIEKFRDRIISGKSTNE